MATVFFLDLRKKYKGNYFTLFDRLINASRALNIIKKNGLCALKIHVGEDGNINFINPLYIRHLCDRIAEHGGRPFLTDTTTLYSGRRYRGDLHVQLAQEHGFNFAPFLVADGVYGDDYVDINGSKIASLFNRIDTIICVSHFKGHLNCGFGGALKNLGMGCASKGGKLEMHSSSKPRIDEEKCTQCLRCFEYCLFRAVVNKQDSVLIDEKICTGCGGCMSVCPEKAIVFSWDAASSDLQKSIAKYASDAIKGKDVFYFNFLVNISANCDCFHTNEPVIAPDIGIFASQDPVSIDHACYDYVKEPIDELHPDINPQEQLMFAETFGAGELTYEIKEVQSKKEKQKKPK